MKKYSLSDIKRQMEELKNTALPKDFCVAFLKEESNETYQLKQTVYKKRGKRETVEEFVKRISTPDLKELASEDVSEERKKEIIAKYELLPPECDQNESLLFVYDYGK